MTTVTHTVLYTYVMQKMALLTLEPRGAPRLSRSIVDTSPTNVHEAGDEEVRRTNVLSRPSSVTTCLGILQQGT